MTHLPAERACVISTHLDDAVLSCGASIAAWDHPLVLTVFTDAPPVDRTDGWNYATTGEPFAPRSQSVRRDEDAVALALLDAEPAWLGLHEAEYRPDGQNIGELAAAIGAFLDDRDVTDVVAPLGLRHPDHLAVADACRLLMSDRSPRRWRVALDLPYARTFPDLVRPRLDALLATGFELVEVEPVRRGECDALRSGVDVAWRERLLRLVGRRGRVQHRCAGDREPRPAGGEPDHRGVVDAEPEPQQPARRAAGRLGHQQRAWPADHRALRQHDQSEDVVFTIGPYSFHPANKLLESGDGTKIRLTDKETSILKYLYRQGPKTIGRDVLLKEVWGYNNRVTTHTLETHIYRLRQKIERDPSNARLLVTEEGGYRLVP